MDLANEEAILNYIFDPNKSFIASAQLGGFGAGDVPTEEIKKAAQEISEEDLILERQAVRMAEGGEVEESYKLFDDICAKYPEHAAGFNNRAQAHRMKGDDDKALEDINRAIDIVRNRYKEGLPNYKVIEDALERYRVKRDSDVLSQSLCQRGLLQRKRGNEQASKTDFEEAARLGSGVAAKMKMVHSNFYATICHRAVEEAMESEIPGFKNMRHH